MALFEQDGGWTYIDSPYVKENSFRHAGVQDEPLPAYDEVKEALPQPVWEGHELSLAAYDFTWRTAFGNLKQPAPGSGFVRNFIDTAFNDCLFMWDSSFILMFGKYADHLFPFQHTLDNFYAKQHRDGFICREIDEGTGKDCFVRFDPSATGPNIMPWCEWEYFRSFGDIERLSRVFAPLLALHLWMKANYTWRDGGYFSSGWGCGMDNIPRLEPGDNEFFSHGHMIWLDVCLQQLFSAKILTRMATILNRTDDVAVLNKEIADLTKLVNTRLWDEKTAFYYDLWKDGRQNGVKSIGAYWALLADVVPPDRLKRFTAHLSDEKEFCRPHRIPTLSADDPHYCPEGNYWRGSVWAPVNYMVLRGLRQVGLHELAYAIAVNHHRNVCEVFRRTGTLWENYSPERPEKGSASKADFVGWTGLSTISILFEFVFGIQPDYSRREIVWRVKRTERHGILRYPFGPDGMLTLLCEPRASSREEPKIFAESNLPVQLCIIWDGGEKTIQLNANGIEAMH